MSLPLAPYAVSKSNSQGRQHVESAPSYRTEFQRDRDRIVHCTAFRRLEYKTQVFVNHEGDLFRTRLTHSIEVAQISRAIARTLHLNEDLVEAIALAHDLGHTPFGHAGQDALNESMREFGGFEHNLQSLRVVDHLEEKYAEFNGLNLTYEAREGILKHCSQQNAQQLGEIGLRFIHHTQPSLEAQLTNLADEIAYNNHDIDDGLRAKLINTDQLQQIPLFQEQYHEVIKSYPKLPEKRIAHEVIRRMINRLASDLIATSRHHIQHSAPETLEDIRQQKQPLIKFSPAMKEMSFALKQFLRKNMYNHYRIYRMTKKAKQIVQGLFQIFFNDVHLMPTDHAQKALQAEHEQGLNGRARKVCDYIAGMTDRFAISEYNKLFGSENIIE